MTVDRPLLSIRRNRADDAPAMRNTVEPSKSPARATTSRLIEHALATSRDREFGLPICVIATADAIGDAVRSVVEDILERPIVTMTLPEDAAAFGGRTAIVEKMTARQLRRILTATGVEHAMFATDARVSKPPAVSTVSTRPGPPLDPANPAGGMTARPPAATRWSLDSDDGKPTRDYADAAVAGVALNRLVAPTADA